MDELIKLVAVLCIPDPLITPNHYLTSALEAFALTCACFHSPDNQWALGTRYCHPKSAISQITHEVVSNCIYHVNRVWKVVIHNGNRDQGLEIEM